MALSSVEKEWNIWVGREAKILSEHYIKLARRYAFRYNQLYGTPIGRPIALFMMWYNNKHSGAWCFSDKCISWWYTY